MGEPWVPPETPPEPSGGLLLDLPMETDSGMTLPDFGIPVGEDQIQSPPGLVDDETPDQVCEWIYDHSSHTYHRQITRLEALENGWDEDSLLVISPDFSADIDREHPVIEIGIPTFNGGSHERPDWKVTSLRFFLRGRTSPVLRIDGPGRSGGGSTSVRYPVYATSRKLSSGTYTISGEQRLARLVTGPGAHASIRGLAHDGQFHLKGPIRTAFTEVPEPLEVVNEPMYLVTVEHLGPGLHVFDLITPPSEAAEANVVESVEDYEQCTDNLDNDGDGVADSCDFECIPHEDWAGPPGVIPLRNLEATKSFGLFGDLLYCSQNDGWDVDLVAVGMEAAQILNWIDQGTDIDDFNPPFRVVNIACDSRDSGTAVACQSASECPEDLSDWPLAGVGNNFSGYLLRGWALADWYVDGNQAIPMHAAVTVTTQDGVADGGADNLAGLSFFIRTAVTDEDHQRRGASVINVNRYGGYLNIAHEIGHSMGLPHDGGAYMPVEWFTVHGVMNTTEGSAPFLGPAAAAWWGQNEQIPVTPSQAWLGYVRFKDWPRPSGFSYTGGE
jgi:hypothetical protein